MGLSKRVRSWFGKAPTPQEVAPEPPRPATAADVAIAIKRLPETEAERRILRAACWSRIKRTPAPRRIRELMATKLYFDAIRNAGRTGSPLAKDAA